ncbi:hypothetical protein [Candidatus Raskinella chloraquaticus]|jgi:hypothetical protein
MADDSVDPVKETPKRAKTDEDKRAIRKAAHSAIVKSAWQQGENRPIVAR